MSDLDYKELEFGVISGWIKEGHSGATVTDNEH